MKQGDKVNIVMTDNAYYGVMVFGATIIDTPEYTFDGCYLLDAEFTNLERISLNPRSSAFVSMHRIEASK